MQPDSIAQGLSVKDHVGRAANVVMRACTTPLCSVCAWVLASGSSNAGPVARCESTSALKTSPVAFDAEWEAFELKVQSELVKARKLQQMRSSWLVPLPKCACATHVMHLRADRPAAPGSLAAKTERMAWTAC